MGGIERLVIVEPHGCLSSKRIFIEAAPIHIAQ
jgi:hypothetical protein